VAPFVLALGYGLGFIYGYSFLYGYLIFLVESTPLVGWICYFCWLVLKRLWFLVFLEKYWGFDRGNLLGLGLCGVCAIGE
jgi:hypothetical protein